MVLNIDWYYIQMIQKKKYQMLDKKLNYKILNKSLLRNKGSTNSNCSLYLVKINNSECRET